MADPGEIKLFKFIQKTYDDIGIIPPQSNQDRRRFTDLKKWFIPFCLAQYFFSSTAYLWFDANSIIEYGMAFYPWMCIVLAVISWLILFLQMEFILNYIGDCERFVEKRKNSTFLYKDTSKKIEQFTEFFGYGLFITIVIFVMPALLYTIVNYYFLDSGKDSFVLFFRAWWPFDWKTPSGYLVAWMAQCAGVAGVLIAAVSIFNTTFGSTWLFIVIVGDISNDVAAFNKIVKILRNADRAELMRRFCDIIQHYSDAKQLINDFNEISQYSFFGFFAYIMLSISTLLTTLQFQLWSDDSKLFEIWILSMLTLWMFGFNLAICELGERITEQFEQFGVEFDRCKWNKLSIKMQRMYLIFLSDTQQPKYLRCYGGIMSTRDTFKQITTKGLSYFMTLRNFGE